MDTLYIEVIHERRLWTIFPSETKYQCLIKTLLGKKLTEVDNKAVHQAKSKFSCTSQFLMLVYLLRQLVRHGPKIPIEKL